MTELLAYLDSSALVKLALQEPESRQLEAYVYPAAVATSEIAIVEVTRACKVAMGDEEGARRARDLLRNAAGNFYLNCKSTGAVVGQQPFGGSRASGTNDKAGSQSILSRFVSARSIKEEFVATTKVEYPSNEV